MKIVNATIMLTRKCNLSCEYCNIFNNEYPNELSGKQWCKALNILKHLHCGFNILLGGEPSLHPDIFEIINHCHGNQLPYAFCTNGVFKGELKRQLKGIQLKNYSISYDGAGANVTANSGSQIKSNMGLGTAIEMKNSGVKDIHATITVTKKNLEGVPIMVEFLTSLGIWAEVTYIHWSKGKRYDYFPTKEEMKDLIITREQEDDVNKVMDLLIEMKKGDRFLIHNDVDCLETLKKHIYELDWKCNSIASLCIEADGKMRTCLHYNGKHCKKFTIFDLKNKNKLAKFIKAHEKDREECEGCAWDCFISAEKQLEKLGHEKTISGFQHVGEEALK